ncbi:helix-turn-helix transcriptional regulator [uncultured Jatrophihabitans sp.]|uniref:helix-turn-helix transcriptional regulator n=1 Tax=uncultured Jatrophihabitans sp. TaxID=1610747 RepID=UPI0035C9C1B1
MDNRSEVRDFLTTRRARLTPEQAGLPSFGSTRRVKGLRREEVATLAGVSVDYYNRMERGSLNGVSDQVLEAVSAALQLDDAERAHLIDLAHSNTARRVRKTAPHTRVRSGLQLLLDGMTDLPAYVRNGWYDILAVNALGAALLPDLAPDGTAIRNMARYLFLDAQAQDFYADWETVARDCVAALRIEAGRDPYNRRLTDLVGELTTRSEPFRTWWATHNVRLHNSATKLLRHPVVGDVEVTGQALTVPADPGLTIIAYTVEPASTSSEALRVLASWAATSRAVTPTEYSA